MIFFFNQRCGSLVESHRSGRHRAFAYLARLRLRLGCSNRPLAASFKADSAPNAMQDTNASSLGKGGVECLTKAQPSMSYLTNGRKSSTLLRLHRFFKKYSTFSALVDATGCICCLLLILCECTFWGHLTLCINGSPTISSAGRPNMPGVPTVEPSGNGMDLYSHGHHHCVIATVLQVKIRQGLGLGRLRVPFERCKPLLFHNLALKYLR